MTLAGSIGIFAGVLSFIGFLPYWWAIWQGQTRPNRATWWIWSVVGIAIALSYRAAGADATMWVPITYIIGPLGTSLLGIKFGEGGWTKLDRLCLVGVGIGLILWGLYRSPELTLIINIGIDLLGALPTIRKSWYDPKSENRLAWLCFAVASTCNLFAIDRWQWQVAIYPIYMFFITITIYSLLALGGASRRRSI